jgi:hypothetical protein
MSVRKEQTNSKSWTLLYVAIRSLVSFSVCSMGILGLSTTAKASPCDIGICVIDDLSQVSESGPRNLEVTLDRLPFGDLNGTLLLNYTPNELLRKVSASELPNIDEASIAVRLIISEVGADRLIESQHGLEEAIAILHTIGNRLTTTAFDPDNANITPYEGCGPAGSIGTCANPHQYLGMATRRALKPLESYNRDTVIEAADIALLAWNLYQTETIEDFTGGATVYVHRCGGTAYGQTTYHCDGTTARGIVDTQGANPHTGPMILSAPVSTANGGGDYLRSNGYYNIRHSHQVDYETIDQSISDVAVAEAEIDSPPIIGLPSINSSEDDNLRLWLTPLAP